MEYRDLYNEKREWTGKTVRKGDPIPSGCYYITVAIVIENSAGQFLIQKRSARKGGLWAMTGGHPVAGENSREGIITEVKEELGLDISNDQVILFHTIKTEDDFFDLYYLKREVDLKTLTYRQEEVETAAWITKEKLKQLIVTGQFHPSHLPIVEEVMKWLREYTIPF